MIDINQVVVNPMDVLEEASQGPTPQARLWRNPYARVAIIAYDKLRFEHSHIGVLQSLLIDLAFERFKAGKKTTVDFLTQEALRIGEVVKNSGLKLNPTPLEIYQTFYPSGSSSIG